MAVFDDPETFHPNAFLLNGGDDDNMGNHQQDCFCRRCRETGNFFTIPGINTEEYYKKK